MMLVWLGFASAYELAGSTWAWQENPVESGFQVNPEGFPFPEAEVLAAHRESLRVWTAQAGTPLVMSDGGTSTSSRYGDGPDGLNLTTFVSFTLGYTLAISARTVRNGEIADCDVKFYGANTGGTIPWSIAESGAGSDQQDLRQTWIHEQGHCLGLSHSQVRDAVMYATAPQGLGPADRRLHPDDIAGMQAMYGRVDPMLVVVDVREGALSGGRAPLIVGVENIGTGTAWGVRAEFTALRALTSVTPTELDLGDLRSMSGAEASVEIAFAADCTPGEAATVRLRTADEAGAEWTDELTLDLRCPSPAGEDSGAGSDSGGADSGEGTPGIGCACRSGGPAGGSGFLAVMSVLTLVRRVVRSRARPA